MNLINKLPKKYQNKVESILDGKRYCDNDDVKFFINLKEGWIYDNEYTAYPCENWKEVLMVAKYAERI